MATTILIRRGTKAQLDNITLSSGEMGFTTDTQEMYVGDGSNNYLVGRVLVDISGNRPYAGVEGRMFYATELSATYIDTGSEWISINEAVDVDESSIDHNQLLNYDPNEHIDHTTVSILTNAPLTGGGDITANRTLDINIDSNDLAVDGSNQLYVKDSGIDHDSTANVHQNVNTKASPQF